MKTPNFTKVGPAQDLKKNSKARFARPLRGISLPSWHTISRLSANSCSLGSHGSKTISKHVERDTPRMPPHAYAVHVPALEKKGKAKA